MSHLSRKNKFLNIALNYLISDEDQVVALVFKTKWEAEEHLKHLQKLLSERDKVRHFDIEIQPIERQGVTQYLLAIEIIR